MCALITDQSFSELARWSVSLAVPAFAGLGGVLIGAWLTGRRDRQQRQLAFLEKQLSLFYSPILGVRNEIKAHGKLRIRVQQEAQAAWVQLCSEAEGLPVQERQKITTERGPEFSRIIEYDNERVHKELLPAYHKMIALFRENYWLAEPTTREYYPAVLEFTDIWERWTERALPFEVLKRLEHSEEKLNPFYAHLASVHDEIRRKLKAGTSDA